MLSDRRTVWDGFEEYEERETASDAVLQRFFPEGYVSRANAGDALVSYRTTRDHLGSAREVVDQSGTVRARYDYDPYGVRSANLITTNPIEADFGFTGHYYHPASKLALAPFRAYDAELGRWLNRDPLGEQGGLNLYAYVENNSINLIDPTGEAPADWADSMDGYLNIAQDAYTTDRHWVWDGTVGTAGDLLRGIADVLRFGDGAGRAIYDPCLDGVGRSGAVVQDLLRGTSLVSGGGAVALRGGAWLGGTRAGYLLNHNRYLRLGPGNVPRNASMSRGPGQGVPTLRIGNQKPSRRNHFDLRVLGH